jgi:hypothetical protein
MLKPFHGYFPTGYNPVTGQKQTDPVPELDPALKRLALSAGASHIDPAGTVAYRIRFGKVDEAYPDEGFASWWATEAERVPVGAVKLND